MAASDGVRGAKVSRLAFPPSEWRNHRLLVLMAITPMSGTAYVAEESIIWSTGKMYSESGCQIPPPPTAERWSRKSSIHDPGETTPWRCALGTGQNVPGTRGGSRRERQIAALVIRSFKGLSAIDFHAFDRIRTRGPGWLAVSGSTWACKLGDRTKTEGLPWSQLLALYSDVLKGPGESGKAEKRWGEEGGGGKKEKKRKKRRIGVPAGGKGRNAVMIKAARERNSLPVVGCLNHEIKADICQWAGPKFWEMGQVTRASQASLGQYEDSNRRSGSLALADRLRSANAGSISKDLLNQSNDGKRVDPRRAAPLERGYSDGAVVEDSTVSPSEPESELCCAGLCWAGLGWADHDATTIPAPAHGAKRDPGNADCASDILLSRSREPYHGFGDAARACLLPVAQRFWRFAGVSTAGFALPRAGRPGIAAPWQTGTTVSDKGLSTVSRFSDGAVPSTVVFSRWGLEYSYFLAFGASMVFTSRHFTSLHPPEDRCLLGGVLASRRRPYASPIILAPGLSALSIHRAFPSKETDPFTSHDPRVLSTYSPSQYNGSFNMPKDAESLGWSLKSLA
ncbi:hypothetical protein JHW43_009445 [Diplocarpon mali]|nr:hypothetical protein JHW43_009445 [Diplocarpon mali]